MHNDTKRAGRVHWNLLSAVLAVLLLVTGCAANPGDSRAKQGARSGAAFGAGIGLLLGVLSGDAGKAVKGMAVGAGLGAAQGGYEGWRQDQDDERTRQITRAIRDGGGQQAGLDAEARERENLTRFLGVWNMQGWLQEPGAERVNVSAQVNGNVQMSLFVELAYLDLKVEGLEGQVWGTTTLGYSAASGYEISTRFNTLPDAIEADDGRFDSATRTFTFADAQATTDIRFETPDRFTVVTRVGPETVESYVFTRI